jgi:hypothetical protein
MSQLVRFILKQIQYLSKNANTPGRFVLWSFEMGNIMFRNIMFHKRSNLVAQRPSYFQKQPVASTVFKVVDLSLCMQNLKGKTWKLSARSALWWNGFPSCGVTLNLSSRNNLSCQLETQQSKKKPTYRLHVITQHRIKVILSYSKVVYVTFSSLEPFSLKIYTLRVRRLKGEIWLASQRAAISQKHVSIGKIIPSKNFLALPVPCIPGQGPWRSRTAEMPRERGYTVNVIKTNIVKLPAL